MKLKCDNTTTFELKLVIMESKNLNSNCVGCEMGDFDYCLKFTKPTA